MSAVAKVIQLTAILVIPANADAQEVIKPRNTTTTDRLPKPASVSASQEPTGRIRVVWSLVGGAERYQLVRSSPPGGPEPVTLPNSSDTTYLDSDVQPGRTYYYLVNAVNEAGIPGLKAAAPPVKAEDLARAPNPPGDVRAVLNGTQVQISWSAPHADVRYTVERLSGGAGAGGRILDLGPCCQMIDNVENVAGGLRVRYQVTAVSSKGIASPPGLSNEIAIPAATSNDTTPGQTPPGDAAAARTRVLPAVIAEPSTLRVGDPALRLGSSPTFAGLKLRKPRWLSLDESVATVNAQGRVRSRSAGSTHIIALGTTPDGSIALMVARIDVSAR